MCLDAPLACQQFISKPHPLYSEILKNTQSPYLDPWSILANHFEIKMDKVQAFGKNIRSVNTLGLGFRLLRIQGISIVTIADYF